MRQGNVVKDISDRSRQVMAPGPSMFAVDPAAENGVVPPYAHRPLLRATSHVRMYAMVWCGICAESEGPGVP